MPVKVQQQRHPAKYIRAVANLASRLCQIPQEYLKFYIDGQWVSPEGQLVTKDVINPATEEVVARIALGSKTDVDKAVKAARRAFETFGETSREFRIELLEKIVAILKRRMGEMAGAISEEMGAPMWLAKSAQAPGALGHFNAALRSLKNCE